MSSSDLTVEEINVLVTEDEENYVIHVPKKYYSTVCSAISTYYYQLDQQRLRKLGERGTKSGRKAVRLRFPQLEKIEKGSAHEEVEEFEVKLLNDGGKVPTRQSEYAAGYDLYAAAHVIVPPQGRERIATGIAVAIPEGYYGRVAPRSGLAWKNGIDVGAGVIDSDYRGPVDVILFNHGKEPFTINAGDRIAQLIIEKIITPTPVVVENLSETKRSDGGFGSTGK